LPHKLQTPLRQNRSGNPYLKEHSSIRVPRHAVAYTFQGMMPNITQKQTHTKTLITNKCTKTVLSSIVTHSYMFQPCWVIFRENFFVIVTLRMHFTVE
jgi:hypothetical protein